MEEKRKSAVKTKKGIIIYKKEGKQNDWKYNCPGLGERYGECTTRKLINFLMLIDEGKTVKEAEKIAFERK